MLMVQMVHLFLPQIHCTKDTFKKDKFMIAQKILNKRDTSYDCNLVATYLSMCVYHLEYLYSECCNDISIKCGSKLII